MGSSHARVWTVVRRGGMLAALLMVLLTAGRSAARPDREITAADRETARSLMDDGDRKFAAEDYRGALDAYLGADRIMGVPTTGIEVGKAQEKLGLLVDARDAWLRVTRYPRKPREPEAFTKARDEARALAAAIVRRIPSLEIHVKGVKDGVPIAVQVDGAELAAGTHRLPRKVNPGDKVIQVSAAGYQLAEERLSIAEGEQRVVEIELEYTGKPAPPLPEPTGPTGPGASVGPDEPATEISPLVWIGFGVGGACLIFGGITGGISLSQTSDIEGTCIDGQCPRDQRDAIDDANLMANLSNVGFGVGAAGILVGVVGLLLSGPEEPDSEAAPAETAVRVTPLVGPGVLGVQGRF